ncbi:unnamed protein product [Orchesella dallaii]|uniref:N(6)-L-threonylcarbamoyladenine synthase n=1 Tax=Orchesella dallaii TaxID=48710 RepID=A0ABP1QAX3_9HEXA
MHRYRALSRNLFLVSPSISRNGGTFGGTHLNAPWLRNISSSSKLCTNGSDSSYKSISEILNVTSSGKQDSPEEIVTEYDRVREIQSSTHHSGPGGITKTGVILGIETSADDTGAAVVTTEKKILGEALNSQLQIHLNHGGIIPPIAKHLHEQHIGRILKEAMNQANVTVHDLDAIATTVKPGLSLCLLVGMKYGKNLCIEGNKPFIPVHHMKAHALTCRMLHDLEFPYMVLLVSGGHCLLTIARSIEDFDILGSTIDDAPGEAFDKTARRLKLNNLKEGSSLSGGAAIEYYATKGNPEAFQFPTPMYKYRDCNWSFSGLKFIALRHILREERKYGELL